MRIPGILVDGRLAGDGGRGASPSSSALLSSHPNRLIE